MSVTFTKINSHNIKLKVDKMIDKKIAILSEQILKDCNEFCREDQGTLITSSQIASDLARGLLVWDAPYAKKVYYTGVPSKDSNNNASLMWVEKARAVHGKEWEKMAQKLMGKEV